MAASSADRTSPLRARRLAQQPRPWTQTRLVHEIQRTALELGIPVASRASLTVQLSRWENGHVVVGPAYRSILRKIYSATDEELGLAPASPPVGNVQDGIQEIPSSGSWGDVLAEAITDWAEEMERRDFLRTSTYLAAGSALPTIQWLIGETEAIERRSGNVTVGTPHIESIREMTRTFRALDNRFGGEQARRTMLQFLTNDVAPLVQGGRYDAVTGASLLAVSAESMQLLGWMSFDAGMQRHGQRYMGQALRLARAAGDENLGAEIMSGLSHQASYLRDSATAVELARAAARTATLTGNLVLVAEAAVMEAHGHSCAGDSRASAQALSRAETTLDKADRSSGPQWIAYFDEAYLSAKFGHCFLELRQADQAITHAERSLQMDQSYIRGRTFNLGLLAMAHAQAGDIDAACIVGTEALNLTAGLHSNRAREYMTRLCGELARWDSPRGREFIGSVERALQPPVQH